jgi:hypothetical protein
LDHMMAVTVAKLDWIDIHVIPILIAS